MRLSLPVLICGLFATAAFAETPADVVQWSATVKPLMPAAGAKATVSLVGHVKPGWHLYSITQPPGGPIATRVSFPGDSALQLDGSISGSSPERKLDPNFNMETETYTGDVHFEIPVRVASDAKVGNVDVRFQVCSDRLCLPPTRVHVGLAGFKSASVTGEATTGATAGLTGNATPPTSGQVSGPKTNSEASARPTAATTQFGAATNPQSQPLLAYLWFAMGMGALSLLTPCVFPMVPITVSYFSNHGSGSRSGAALQALVYGLGIVLTFSGIGIALALIFGAGGVNQLAANPWVNLLITFIFIGFAFSLFGAYLIQLPVGLMSALNSKANSAEAGGFVGALLMGFTFSLTSFTCTAPFVGTLLVTAAQGNWHWPLLGMLAYSTVFALPFFVLALAPQLVGQLPKAGGWMNSVKVVMGFLEIAAAMKFLSNADLVWHWNIFTRQTVLAVWIATGVLIVLYLFGIFRFEHDTPPKYVSAWRMATALAFLAISISLVPGLFGRPLGELESFLPPADESAAINFSGTGNQNQTAWVVNDLAKAKALAAEQKKPIFIDFTGYTCTNCRWMEANIFPKPEVRSRFARYITLRLYTDGEGAIYEQQQKWQQERFGTVALPLYAVVDADGKTVATFPGLTRSVAEFTHFLEQGFAAST